MGENNPGLISYLSSFNFDCIFFFDEFEKQFDESDCSILQIMDGVYNSEFRKIFLLTTNQLNINPNLLSRPSRIRYVREFGNLSKSVVEEYLDDNLKDNSGREDLLNYIDTLTISTIDILKAIVEEVNIHGVESFLEAKKFFNVEIASYTYRGTSGRVELEDVKDGNYNIQSFLKDVYAYKNRYALREKFNSDMEVAKNDDERIKIKKAYNEASRITAHMDYFTVYEQDKAWDKLKPDKDLFNNEQVIGVDVKNNVVVTTVLDGYIYFYLIENPSQRPSLYQESFSNLQGGNLNLL
jgi:hypothetical protein